MSITAELHDGVSDLEYVEFVYRQSSNDTTVVYDWQLIDASLRSDDGCTYVLEGWDLTKLPANV
jgi:hypothetical protein